MPSFATTAISPRHNRRFSSPSDDVSPRLVCTSRRALLFSTTLFVLLLFLGLRAHSSGALPLTGISRDGTFAEKPVHWQPVADEQGTASRPLSVRAATRIQNELNAKTHMHRRPTCSWTPWHDIRYKPLRNTNRRIVLAMNLHQNRELMSTIAQELPVVLEWVGVKNIFVTVYEDGSSDGTAEYLGDLSRLFDALGVAHHIVSYGDSRHANKDNDRRIAVLAAARNTALSPLFTGQAALALGGEPHEIFFVNDIFFCAPDLLEVLLQFRQQGMHQACATDWDPGQIVYDRWILRTMSGRNFYKTDNLIDWFNGPNDRPKHVPSTLPDDPADQRRWEKHLPLQVFSCWNGATVIDAKAFLPPHNLRFRQSRSDWEDEAKSIWRNATQKASECYLSSVDLWKMGFNRIGLVPKASVAYTADLYDKYRKDGELYAPKGDLEVFEWIGNWKESPPEKVAYQDYTWWHLPERWGAWDEQ